MRVGVTGASGFLGTALVSALAARGDEVVAFVRPQSRRATSRTVAWDPGHGVVDLGDLERAGPLDALVHLAGAGIGDRRWNDARKRVILTSRTESTALLVDALQRTSGRPAFLASGSAVGYYGSSGSTELFEDSPPGRDFLATVCVEWERAAQRLGPDGDGAAVLRTGIVLSRDGGALARQLGLFRLGLGGRLGPGTQWVSPISLEDTVRAILFVIDRRLSGPFNLTAPCALTNRDFTAALARAVRRPAILAVPSAALRLALGTEMANELVLASQRAVPRRLMDAGFVFRHGDIDAILPAALRAAT